MLALPEACNFVTEAVDAGRQVLVHCPQESAGCAVVCASCNSFSVYGYFICPDFFLVMSMRKIPPKDASAQIEAGKLLSFYLYLQFGEQLHDSASFVRPIEKLLSSTRDV